MPTTTSNSSQMTAVSNNKEDDNGEDLQSKQSNNTSNNTNNHGNQNQPTDQTINEIHLASPTIGSNDINIKMIDLNIKTADMGCLNIVTSPSSTSPGTSNSHNNSNNAITDTSPWSTGEDNNVNLNNIGGFVNYSTNHNYNGHLSQQQRRPITSASHQGLSPGQYNQYKNNYTAWSSNNPAGPIPLQQPQQQGSLLQWNRGGNVQQPQLNQQRKPLNHYQNQSNNNINMAQSPSKYRHNNSYACKNMINVQGYNNMMNPNMDMNINEDGRGMDSLMPYQVIIELIFILFLKKYSENSEFQ